MSDYIPEDNLGEIFKLLPVKSLLRFRCVSQGWRQLIDSSFFLQAQLSVQKPRIVIHVFEYTELIIVDPHTLRSFPLGSILRLPRRAETRSSDEEEEFMVIGTLHGVTCLFGEDRDLLLWNPSICKLSILPLPDIAMDFKWDQDIFIEGCSGFWIDPCNKEFKIIVFNLGMICDEEGEYMDVYGVLYSSIKSDWRVIPLGESGKWKPLQGCLTKMEGRVGDWRPSGFNYTAPIMIRGVGYWEGRYLFKNEQGHHQELANVILSFEFKQESFEFLEMPIQECSTYVHAVPFQWQGTLSLLCWKNYTLGCEIYSRQEDSWVSIFRFDLISPVNVVHWVVGEMEESFRFLADDKDGLVLYDTKDGIHCISFKGEYFVNVCTCVAYDFVESLLFPTSVNPNRQLLKPDLVDS